MPQSNVVTRRKVVLLQYSLSNDNGDIFHDAASDPILYVHGYSALFPKLLVGTDTDGNEIGFRITGIQDGIVYLDGNNPLAGHTLIFEIEIQGIRDATNEEIKDKSVKIKG